MPEVGHSYRLTHRVEGTDGTGLDAELAGTVIAIDQERDCAIIRFQNGRNWSHPLAAWDDLFEVAL